MDTCQTAAEEDITCICQELNKHLQLSQQKVQLQQHSQKWHLNHMSQSVDTGASGHGRHLHVSLHTISYEYMYI